MKIEALLKQQIKRSAASSPQDNALIKALLEYLANFKEHDINKRLLRELVSKYAAAEKQLRHLNQELAEKQRLITSDLLAAAEIQKTLLPKSAVTLEGFDIAWIFEPCDQMGGDIFNILRIDDDYIVIYMLDVSGHGVPAAMITVSVSQFLQQNLLRLLVKEGDPEELSPARVLAALDDEFPFERFNNFFTMTFITINTNNGSIIYSNGGHPYPIIVRNNNELELLNKKGHVIGMGSLSLINDRKAEFEEGRLKINPGDKLFVYSDGIVEYQNHLEELYGEGRFCDRLKAFNNEPVTTIVDGCIKDLMEFGNQTKPQDDISLIGMEFIL